MQYILTEEEYRNLKRERQYEIDVSRDELQKLCTEIANKMPVIRPWAKDEPASPWGCILTEKWEHYCDQCPVHNICPSTIKNYSQ